MSDFIGGIGEIQQNRINLCPSVAKLSLFLKTVLGIGNDDTSVQMCSRV